MTRDFVFFFSSRRRHTRSLRDWSSDVCSSDLSPRGAHVKRRAEAGFPRAADELSTKTNYANYLRKQDRKSTRLNSSHVEISYAVFCLKKKINHCGNSQAPQTNPLGQWLSI